MEKQRAKENKTLWKVHPDSQRSVWIVHLLIFQHNLDSEIMDEVVNFPGIPLKDIVEISFGLLENEDKIKTREEKKCTFI